MKRILLLFAILLHVPALAQNDLLNLDSTAAHVRKLQESRSGVPSTTPFNLQELRELRLLVVRQAQLLGGHYGPNFSPVREQLEPLRSLAKQLAESERPDDRYYGAFLNSSLNQTDETRALLLKLAHDERPETAGTAMDTLFALNLDTPELRKQLVDALQEDKPPREHTTLHSLAMTNVGKWGVHEAVPALMEILEASVAKGGPISGPAVMQLKALGPQAKEALPLLRQAVEMRRAAGDADFKELEALDFAVQVIGGEAQNPQASLPSPPNPPPTTTLSNAVDDKAASAAKPAPPTRSEEPPSPTRWPVAAAVVVVALGLLWVLLKKRK